MTALRRSTYGPESAKSSRAVPRERNLSDHAGNDHFAGVQTILVCNQMVFGQRYPSELVGTLGESAAVRRKAVIHRSGIVEVSGVSRRIPPEGQAGVGGLGSSVLLLVAGVVVSSSTRAVAREQTLID